MRKGGFRQLDKIIALDAYSEEDSRLIAKLEEKMSVQPIIRQPPPDRGSGTPPTGTGSGSATPPDPNGGSGSTPPNPGTGSSTPPGSGSAVKPPTPTPGSGAAPTTGTGSAASIKPTEPEPDFVKKP